MKSSWIVLTLAILLIACSQLSLIPNSSSLPTQEPPSIQPAVPAHHLIRGIMLSETQRVVNNLRALCCEDGWWNYLFEAENKFSEAQIIEENYDIGAAFLKSMEEAGKRFEVNEYFKVLTHLALEDGYVLDYVYFAPGGDGFPKVYARPVDEPPFANYSEYEETSAEDYLSHIHVDGTAEGYFELAVLDIMGEQFYLSWHAEYNDWEVVSSRDKLETIIEGLNKNENPLAKDQVEAALKLDVTPRVQLEENEVHVRMVVFTKWGGFYERIYMIDQAFPHLMVDDDIQLIPYDCGIAF